MFTFLCLTFTFTVKSVSDIKNHICFSAATSRKGAGLLPGTVQRTPNIQQWFCCLLSWIHIHLQNCWHSLDWCLSLRGKQGSLKPGANSSAPINHSQALQQMKVVWTWKWCWSKASVWKHFWCWISNINNKPPQLSLQTLDAKESCGGTNYYTVRRLLLIKHSLPQRK